LPATMTRLASGASGLGVRVDY
ncbi:MAG: hypothetical protein QOE59_684, partial [Actinomycetota bacterium]|nr:hypothetical protein [Actinomycetota bacterium]